MNGWKTPLISVLLTVVGALLVLAWNSNDKRVTALEDDVPPLAERLSRVEARVDAVHESQQRIDASNARIETQLQALDAFVRMHLGTSFPTTRGR